MPGTCRQEKNGFCLIAEKGLGESVSLRYWRKYKRIRGLDIRRKEWSLSGICITGQALEHTNKKLGMNVLVINLRTIFIINTDMDCAFIIKTPDRCCFNTFVLT